MVVISVLYIVEVTTPTALELVADGKDTVEIVTLMGTSVVEMIVELDETMVVRPVL